MRKNILIILSIALSLSILSCGNDNSTGPSKYETITIGNQVWMKNNLDVEKYQNGNLIRHAQTAQEWIDANNKKEGAWCYLNFDPAMGAIFGKLYNWYAVNDSRKLAPKGYHIPNETDWATLETFLGGREVAGGKLKATDTTHWRSPNSGANNSTGFNALPGGAINGNGIFTGYRNSGFWWSSSEFDGNNAWSYYMYYDHPFAEKNFVEKTSGYSVRCIKS